MSKGLLILGICRGQSINQMGLTGVFPNNGPFSITTPGFTFSKDYTSSSSKWSISWEKAAYLMLY